MNTQVTIADYECMTALGTSLEDTWQGLVREQSGIRSLNRFDPGESGLRGAASVPFAGQIPLGFTDLCGGETQLTRWPEPAYHAVRIVCRRLLDRLAFDIAEHDPQRIAIIGATALTSQRSQEVLHSTAKRNINFIINQCQTTPVAAVAIDHGIKGPVFNVASACASGGHAVYVASHLIEANVVDCALVCGFEFPVLPICTAGFSWLGAMYKRDNPSDRAFDDPAQASRPFSCDRRGFVLSEGVAAILLVRKSYLESTGWSPKGAIRGGCVNSDAGHLTRLSSSDVATCIENALDAAGYLPSDIDMVSAHATSTSIGDAGELHALEQVFGKERLSELPVVASKSQVGHTLGAASLLALIFAVEGMRNRMLLPTLNYRRDTELPVARICDMTTKEFTYHRALINSFGFGGLNAVLIVTDEY